MNETRCRWDREREAYLRDGEPCRTDDYGDPTRHCTARRSCANHVGHGELTCARCIGRTRVDIRVIVARSAELLPEAIESGIVGTELAYLAGPATNVEAWSNRKIAARQGRAWHASLPVELGGDIKWVEEDDERHPFTVLTGWASRLAWHYNHPEPEVWTVSNAADYLERTLPRMAQDNEQDFPLFAREIRKCRSHIEAVLLDSQQPERGAPCPDCSKVGKVVRMAREYGHFCDDPECTRINYSVMFDADSKEFVPDETGDRWVCPANGDHWMTPEGYAEWLRERQYEANRSAS